MPMGLNFGTEFIYTLVIVFLCFLVYYKTKEMYDLTKHKGIKYFRFAFLFFGLSYACRFLIHLIQLSLIAFDFILPKRFLFPVFMVPVGYFSTMAILFLAYSLVWKKLKYRKFINLANIIALTISISAFLYHSPFVLSLIQLPLLISILFIVAKKHSKKKKTNTLGIYFLIIAFWFVSLFLLGPKGKMPYEVMITLELISIALFSTIYYKVSKWIK